MHAILRSLYFRYLPKGTLASGLLLTWVLLFPTFASRAQDATRTSIDRINWATSLSTRTLLVIYPTYTIKHQRIRSAVRNLDTQAKGRQQAEQTMSRDRAYRDTLILALANSFKEKYTFGPVLLMPDTSYTQWRKGKREIQLIDLDLNPIARHSWEDKDVLLLHKKKTSRDTGTGMEIWVAEAPDLTALPRKFPYQFKEGSIGTRFVRFFEAFFSFSHHPDRLEELRVVTDYLARQVDRKWSDYLYSFSELGR